MGFNSHISKMASLYWNLYHCQNKMLLRSSYLNNGISYTDEISSVYWNEILFIEVSPYVTSFHNGIHYSG